MQVTLNAIDWNQLTQFSSAVEFLEWYYALEDEAEFRSLCCYDYGWESDSARQYCEVAYLLKHLASNSPVEMAEHLREGVMKLLADDGHIDEFAMLDPSGGCYWISSSPSSVSSIKVHFDATNLRECVATLRENPPADAEETMSDLDGLFVAFIEQHRRMVDLAASRGYGLLGHCG